MSLWDKVTKDIKKGFDEGIAAVKEGAIVVIGKAEDIAEESKKRYQIFEIKTKIQKHFTNIGGRIYDLTSKKSKNPLTDKKVASLMNGIKKLEDKITKLEGKTIVKPSAKKKITAKRKTVKKPAKKV